MLKSVLYIDDDEGLRALVKRTLAREGVDVTTAADGASGVTLIGTRDFDVIALDHYMPGMDGLATLECIQKLPNHPPVILVTGAEDSHLAVAALKAGAFDYVMKDAQSEFVPLLLSAMQTAVEAMRMRRYKEQAEHDVREARDRFEALAAERALLMREVNHRVGNSLQLIASLLTLQTNANPSPEVKTALGDAIGRVLAVAQLHRRLYTSDDVQHVAVDQYLSALVEDLRRSTEGNALSQLSLEADPVNTHPDRAVAIGVIVNELVMNAVKYAYPDGQGPIRVFLRKESADAAQIVVEDDGVGYGNGGAPGSTGLGQRIVSAMATKLNGTITHDDAHQGARVVVAFKPDRSPHAANKASAA